jgi:hypothetical protein
LANNKSTLYIWTASGGTAQILEGFYLWSSYRYSDGRYSNLLNKNFYWIYTINKYFRWHSITNNHDIYSIIFTCHELNYDFIFQLCQKYEIPFNPLSRYLVLTNPNIEINLHDNYFEILKIQTINIKEIKDADIKIDTPPASPRYKKESKINYINLDNRFHDIAINLIW